MEWWAGRPESVISDSLDPDRAASPIFFLLDSGDRSALSKSVMEMELVDDETDDADEGWREGSATVPALPPAAAVAAEAVPPPPAPPPAWNISLILLTLEP
nr:hypothetical protein BaRGS_003628 [Batillaria attramentaria]